MKNQLFNGKPTLQSVHCLMFTECKIFQIQMVQDRGQNRFRMKQPDNEVSTPATDS